MIEIQQLFIGPTIDRTSQIFIQFQHLSRERERETEGAKWLISLSGFHELTI